MQLTMMQCCRCCGVLECDRLRQSVPTVVSTIGHILIAYQRSGNESQCETNPSLPSIGSALCFARREKFIELKFRSIECLIYTKLIMSWRRFSTLESRRLRFSVCLLPYVPYMAYKAYMPYTRSIDESRINTNISKIIGHKNRRELNLFKGECQRILWALWRHFKAFAYSVLNSLLNRTDKQSESHSDFSVWINSL